MTDELKPPKTFQHCIRCDKDVSYGDTHTCSPSRKFRAGMIEGMKLVFDKIDSSYDSNRMALFNSYGYHEEVLLMIDELIKQYTGKE